MFSFKLKRCFLLVFLILFPLGMITGLNVEEINGYSVKWSYQAPAEIKWFDRWEDGYGVGDLDDDGYADVVIGTVSGKVLAVNGKDGTELWNYQIPNTTEYVNADIVDIDGDNVLDVIAGGKVNTGTVQIMAFNKDGSVKWENPASGDYTEVTDFAYGDINGDGKQEIVAAIGTYSHKGGQVVLFNSNDGSRIWTASLGNGIAFGIDAGDIDHDGDMEVAVTNYDNKVFLIDGKTNTIVWSHSGSYYGRDVIIADVDNDGDCEVTSVMGNAFCFNADGSYEWVNTSGVGENLTRCNPDNNELSELLIVNPWVGECSLVKGDSGKVIWTRSEAGAADVGDLNGDGIDEFIMTSLKWYEPDFPQHYIRVVNCQNKLLWETEFDSEPSALVAANVDLDVNDEVLLTSGNLLIALDIDISTDIAMRDETRLPARAYLFQNYPNPFNPITTIEYALPQNGNVKITIYNILGQPVLILLDGLMNEGYHKILWNGKDEKSMPVPTGVYFCRLETDQFIKTIKLLYIK